MDPAIHPEPPTHARKLRWAGAIALVALATLATAQLHGRRSRVPFQPPPELRGRPVATVADAADAFRVWSAAGIRGRRLVVLTGQWSKPRDARTQDVTPDEVAAARGGEGPDLLDARSALYFAARLGTVRRFDVVMPPAAFTRRLGEVRGTKELERGDGAFRLPFHGLERRFSTPRAFVPPAEPVLVLVEPSWFTDGAPPDPLGWLASAGVSSDLVLLALEDPQASDAERSAALAFSRAAGAPLLEAAD